LVKQGSYAARGSQTSTYKNWEVYKSFGLDLADGYAYRFYVATDDPANVYKYIYSASTITNSKISLALRLGYIAYKDSAGWHNIIAIEANTFYLIELRNFTSTGYDIYIDGELKVSQAEYLNPDGYLTHSVFSGTYNYRDGDIYVDAVIVRKYVAPEPSIISVGSEETQKSITVTLVQNNVALTSSDYFIAKYVNSSMAIATTHLLNGSNTINIWTTHPVNITLTSYLSNSTVRWLLDAPMNGTDAFEGATYPYTSVDFSSTDSATIYYWKQYYVTVSVTKADPDFISTDASNYFTATGTVNGSVQVTFSHYTRGTR